MSDHNKAMNSSGSPKRPRSRDLASEREKNWNYPPGLDNIMATGAFWQNYSGKYWISLLNDIENKRKIFIPAIKSQGKKAFREKVDKQQVEEQNENFIVADKNVNTTKTIVA